MKRFETQRALAKASTVWHRTGDLLLASGLFAASLALYVRTLAPSVATLFDDSLEFPLVVHRLAIAHPTGYPLYILIARLFAVGAGQDLAGRVNLLSAVAAALTVVFVFGAARQLTRRRWPALLGAAALAVSPVFWSQAVIAEVYTLNACFVAALLWLALRWARRPLAPVIPFSSLLGGAPAQAKSPAADGEASPQSGLRRAGQAARRALLRLGAVYRRFFPAVLPRRRLRPHPLLFALAALLGLSLTHHRTVLLIVPALLAYLLVVESRTLSRAALLGPERADRPWALRLLSRPGVLLLLGLGAPLLLYLYLPLRGDVGSLDGTYRNTWSGFWQWVTASGYGAFLAQNPLARDLEPGFYLRLFWQQFGPVGLALALVGVAATGRQVKPLVLTGLAFLTYAAFAVLYRVPDVEVFFIPCFTVVAIWIGVGLDHAVSLLRPRGASLGLRRVQAVAGLLLVLAALVQPLAVALRTYPDVDLSRQWAVHGYGQYALSQPLPPHSTVVGLLGEMTLLRTFQEIMGLRPDVVTVVADPEPDRMEAVEAALAQGGTVYVTRPLPGLAEAHALDSAVGLIDVNGDLQTLIQVGTPVDQAGAVPHPTDLEPASGLRLLGYGLEEHGAHEQAWARLGLWWQSPRRQRQALKVSARLLDADGQLVAATDAEPVAGAYPTTAWRRGEVVTDTYEIPLPTGLPPGDYAPLIIVYDPLTGSERGRAELPPVHLAGNPVRPGRRALEASVAETAYARFGELELLGYTPPDPNVGYRPGQSLPLTLLWQARQPATGQWRLALWLEGETDSRTWEAPLGGRYPVEEWRAGQAVRQWPELRLPDDAPAGTYRLKMRVLHDGQPVVWGRSVVPLGSDLDLGPVRVTP